SAHTSALQLHACGKIIWGQTVNEEQLHVSVHKKIKRREPRYVRLVREIKKLISSTNSEVLNWFVSICEPSRRSNSIYEDIRMNQWLSRLLKRCCRQFSFRRISALLPSSPIATTTSS